MDSGDTPAPRSYRGYCGEHRLQWQATILNAFERAARDVTAEDISESGLYGMLNDLGNVIQFGVPVDGALFFRFFDRLMEIAVSMVGQGDRIHQADFIALLNAAIPSMLAAGLPVWPVYLAEAALRTTPENVIIRLPSVTAVSIRFGLWVTRHRAFRPAQTD